MTSQKKVLTVL